MKLYHDKKELRDAIIHVSLAIFVICLLVAPIVSILMALFFIFVYLPIKIFRECKRPWKW